MSASVAGPARSAGISRFYPRVKRKLKGLLQKDYRIYNRVILPPVAMRLMGEKFANDGLYYESSMHDGEGFVKKLGVNSGSEILEIGCSSGRSVIGLIEKAGPVKRYAGVDTLPKNVNWCNRHIASRHRFCEFYHVDLNHILFNPKGAITLDEDFRYTFDDNSFDIVYLNSVLPNSIDWEIRLFAREFFRLLKPGGTLFVTDFIEEDVPDMTENPENYVMECTYPRQIVRFEKNYFLELFTRQGLKLKKFDYGTEIDRQSGVYFMKP